MKRIIKIAICLILTTLTIICTLTACNNSAQPQNSDSNISNENEPNEEIALVSIDSLWNNYFHDTTFVDDLQSAYNAISEKALPDLNIKVENAYYNPSTSQISLSVSYYEYDDTRRGVIELDAPKIVKQLEDNGIQSVVLNLAGYSMITQIKESDIESAKIAISNAIGCVRSSIEQAFSSLTIEDLSIQKEEIHFITYGEIYDEYYTMLSFKKDIKSNLQLLLNTFINSNPILMWYRLNAEAKTIQLRCDTTSWGSFNGNNAAPKEITYIRRSWLFEIKNIPQIIFDATMDVKTLVFEQLGSSDQISVPVNKSSEVKNIIDNVIMNIKNTLFDALLSINRDDLHQLMETNSIFGSAMDQSKEMETAHKILPDKDILCCYVEAPTSLRIFDDAPNNSEYTTSGPTKRYFIPTSGYITGFNVYILYQDGDNIMRYYARIIVPWYTDVVYTEYWDSFLQGTTTTTGSVVTSTNTRYRYKITSQSTAFECEAEDWIGSVEHSGEIIDDNCSYIIRNDKAYLLSIKNTQTNTYSIPSELGDKEVSGWGISAFAYSSSKASEIEVPNTIEFLMASPVIDGGIFGSNIKYVRLPQTIKSIGWYAFYKCSELIAIYYDGTVEQWYDIIKNPEWDAGTESYVVICTDGTLTKEQANYIK